MISKRKARKLLESAITDEIKDLVKNGKRILNNRKLEAYSNILQAVIEDSKEGDGFIVKHAACDKLSPLSGFISIVGKNISLTRLSDIQNEVCEISYLSIDNYGGEETAVTIGFQEIIELVKE